MASLWEMKEDFLEKQRLKKLQKIQKYLTVLEYENYCKSNEEDIIINHGIDNLSLQQFSDHVYYERVLFALNYIKLEIAYSKYMLTFNRLCEKYEHLDNSEEPNYLRELITIIKNLFDDNLKNPVGFLTIDVLYELITSLDHEFDDKITNALLDHLQYSCMEYDDVDDSLLANYNKYYNYIYLRKNNNSYTTDYLKKIYFDDEYERFCYFDGRNYGGSIKSVNKAINDYNLKDYYELLGNEYVNVLSKMI